MLNANNTGISTYHLSDNPALYEPSRNNTFEFIVTGIDELLRAGISAEVAEDTDYISGPQDIIRLSLAEAPVPHFDLDTVSIKRGNSTMNFAGAPSFSSGSLNFNDYVGARTKDVLLAWQALAYNIADDVVELAAKYKHDCILLEYAPDYSKVVRKWTMKGCWVKTLSEGNFSHDDHNKRMISATIVYDRAIPEIPTVETEA